MDYLTEELLDEISSKLKHSYEKKAKEDEMVSGTLGSLTNDQELLDKAKKRKDWINKLEVDKLKPKKTFKQFKEELDETAKVYCHPNYFKKVLNAINNPNEKTEKHVEKFKKATLKNLGFDDETIERSLKNPA